MSLDPGDFIDGLCNLLELGPFKPKPHWPLWRRNLCFILRLLWWLAIIVLVLAGIMALVT